MAASRRPRTEASARRSDNAKKGLTPDDPLQKAITGRSFRYAATSWYFTRPSLRRYTVFHHREIGAGRMGALMIRCPTTGNVVSTGIHGARENSLHAGLLQQLSLPVVRCVARMVRPQRVDVRAWSRGGRCGPRSPSRLGRRFNRLFLLPPAVRLQRGGMLAYAPFSAARVLIQSAS